MKIRIKGNSLMVKLRSSKSLLKVQVLLPLLFYLMFKFLKKLFRPLRSIKIFMYIYVYIFCKIYDLLFGFLGKINIVRNNLKNEEERIYFYYIKKSALDLFLLNIFNIHFIISDLLFSFIFSKKYLHTTTKFHRFYFRILQTKNGFYFNFLKILDKKYLLRFLKNIFHSGFKLLSKSIRL